MVEMDRRRFLKNCIAIGAGITVESATIAVKFPIAVGLKNLGTETGNANLKDQLDERKLSDYDRFMYAVGLPVSEEVFFRAIPSYILSRKEKAEDPAEETLRGTGGFRMNRRELVLGGVTSAIFALIHNVTPKGINTNILPATQFIGNLSKWYLQRKFGIMANVSAHIFNNSLAVWAIDNSK